MKVAALSFELENIKRALFGSKSERQLGTALSVIQPSLFRIKCTTDTEPVASKQISYERNKPRTTKVQPDRLDIADLLERCTVVVKPQGMDISIMKRIGETIIRRLQHIPASFLIVVTISPKYKEPVSGFIYQALAAVQTFAKSSVDESMAAHIVVQKIIDHLSLYCIARIFGHRVSIFPSVAR